MPRPWRPSRTTQTRSKAAKPVDPHAVRPGLASALLRRLFVWESMAAGSKVTFTSEPHESGLRWTVRRCLTQHARLHDGNVATALAESVAGPGLTADLDGHLCSQRQCVQTFDSGRLTVETVYSEDARPARRPGRARAHVLATFLSERSPWACSALTDTIGVVVRLRVRSRSRRDCGSRGCCGAGASCTSSRSIRRSRCGRRPGWATVGCRSARSSR